MNLFSIRSITIAASASLLMTGCGITPGPKTVAKSAPTPTPQYPSSQYPSSQYAAQQSAAPQTLAAPASGVAQVGYIGDEGECQSGACSASLRSRGACGCQSCASGACNVTPHGYAMPCMTCPPGFDPQEYLCDGGDHDPEAFVRRDDTVGGLDPEDTIVHYTTEAGDIETTASNRVCMYAPRFASVRKVTGAVAGGHAIGLSTVDRPVGTNRIEINEGGVVIGETIELGHADVSRRIDAMRERNRGVPVESVLQPIQNVDIMAALAGVKLYQLNQLLDEQKALVERFALAAVAWTIDESVEVAVQDVKPPTLTRDQSVEGLTLYEFPDAGRLQILKLADRADAKPGEIVTFAIRVENVGDSAVDKITLTDNLTTRLEYVAESQTCSGGAEFSTQSNQADSLQLIWNLTDKLRVGESVTVRFQCKVR